MSAGSVVSVAFTSWPIRPLPFSGLKVHLNFGGTTVTTCWGVSPTVLVHPAAAVLLDLGPDLDFAA